MKDYYNCKIQEKEIELDRKYKLYSPNYYNPFYEKGYHLEFGRIAIINCMTDKERNDLDYATATEEAESYLYEHLQNLESIKKYTGLWWDETGRANACYDFLGEDRNEL